MTVDVQVDNRIAKCQKILESDPNSQIFASLAEAFRKKGDLEKAFRICQDGLRIHPDYGAAHVVMAKVNLDRGLYDWAEAEVNKAIDSDGNNRNIELLLAEIYIYKGEYQSAIKLLKKLHSVDPHNEHIRRLLDIAKKIPQEQQAKIGSPVTESIEQTVIERGSEPVPASADPTALGPADLLREALSIERTQGALYINNEGLVIESRWNCDLDAVTCGAALAEVNKFLNQELMKVSFGQVDTVLIETGNLVFYLIQIATGVFLVVGDAKVNLGTLRMKMADLIQRVETS
jgi:predicted regulator of Ras-like GTPase activity (Roadblock/LC7/MglB family)